MSRKQPARLRWPLTPSQVESLDEMLYELYKRDGTASGSSSSTTVVVTGGSGLGPPGYDGADGDDGVIGPQGLRGATGATGSTGATGPAGYGVPGNDGEDGEQGFPGPMGQAGSAGATGPQGPAGVSINFGIPGSDGLDGYDGWPGPQGNPGPTTRTTSLGIVIDGGGSTITTGIKGDLTVPVGCTIQSVTMLADQSGSMVIDVWKDTYANYPPTVADTITASAKPTITTATKSQDTTLTGWTTAISAGDTIRFNVDSCTSITRVTLSIKVLVL